MNQEVEVVNHRRMKPKPPNRITSLRSSVCIDTFMNPLAADVPANNVCVSHMSNHTRVELFYKNANSMTVVGESTATLYELDVNDMLSDPLYIGYPVFIVSKRKKLKLRQFSHKNQQETKIIMADPNNSFPLWTGNSLEVLKSERDCDALLKSSTNPQKRFLLRFIDQNHAKNFIASSLALLEDDLTRSSSERSRKESKSSKSPLVRNSLKASKHLSISSPCGFVHISHLAGKAADG